MSNKRKSKRAPKITFNEMVDKLAGEALLRLVKGENWHSIMHWVCVVARQTEIK